MKAMNETWDEKCYIWKMEVRTFCLYTVPLGRGEKKKGRARKRKSKSLFIYANRSFLHSLCTLSKITLMVAKSGFLLDKSYSISCNG